MIYIGIDPGKTGGLAIIDHAGNLWQPFPGEEGFGVAPNGGCAVIEIQQPVFLPGGRSNAKATFVLAENFGRWRQWLACNKISSVEVRPTAWQKVMLAGYGWRGKTKQIAWDVARRLFPGVKITKAIADAVCIAEFCRRCNIMTSNDPFVAAIADKESEADVALDSIAEKTAREVLTAKEKT